MGAGCVICCEVVGVDAGCVMSFGVVGMGACVWGCGWAGV